MFSGAGILVANEAYAGLSDNPWNKSFLVKDNVLIRCGNQHNDDYGSIWLWGEINRETSGRVEGNTIISPFKHGITIVGFMSEDVVVTNNDIGKPLMQPGIHLFTRSGAEASVTDNIFGE